MNIQAEKKRKMEFFFFIDCEARIQVFYEHFF